MNCVPRSAWDATGAMLCVACYQESPRTHATQSVATSRSHAKRGTEFNPQLQLRNPQFMRVGLFIPCYIDQFYPHVGMATVRVLRHFGASDLHFPEAQTCCGQPMANTGCTDAAAPLAKRFLDVFEDYDAIVAPSGSCVAMVRHHYDNLIGDHERLDAVKRKTFELCEFLTDVLGVESVAGTFEHRVGLHNSCHGLRELRLGSDSERVGPRFSKVQQLIEGLDGITLCELSRPDECCGFGGTFAVAEEAVSCLMGLDRLADHVQAGTEILTAGDMSCLMHLDGLIRRQRLPIRVMHIAEILDEAIAASAAVRNDKPEIVVSSGQ